jgi:hypothetical protein
MNAKIRKRRRFLWWRFLFRLLMHIFSYLASQTKAGEHNMRQFTIEVDTDCELTYRYANGTVSAPIKGTILAFYQPENEFITFKLKDGKILVISLTHIVSIKYCKPVMEESAPPVKC